VKGQGNKLIVEGPWVSMERERAIAKEASKRICAPQFGERLNDWYAAMERGDANFTADLSGDGYIRFGCGAVITRLHNDGTVSLDGHQRPDVPGITRPGCIDVRAGMLDWNDDVEKSEPVPSLVATLCNEVAEEGITWVQPGSVLKIVQFEEQPFSTHNHDVWGTSSERAQAFFGRQLPQEKLLLRLVTPRYPIEIHFLGEKPFQAFVVDERDTSSLEVVVRFQHETLDAMHITDTEWHRGKFEHRRIFEVWPATGNAKVWLNGDVIQTIQ